MRLVPLIAAMTGVLIADNRCLPCHPAQVKSYASTGMGRSIVPAAGEPASVFTHASSGTTFRVETGRGGVRHSASRNTWRAAYPIAWTIGSGNQGKSYIHRLQDALFQSPVSWFTHRGAYDLSPGFENDRAPDFFRPVTAECLFCHAGDARPRAGTQNRYLDPPFQPAAIGCNRCHGDPAAHLADPGKKTILNPVRLAPEGRDAVCEQCHLSGEARILNPGREFADFRPGMVLEEVFTVYVGAPREQGEALKVVSHSEQMALSRCFVESKSKMWCGSCHDPHSEPLDKVSWFRKKCVACHAGQNIVAHQKKAGGHCAGCHMPQVPSSDGGHTAFHDHWIRRSGEQPAPGQPGGLRAWREPAHGLRNRNLGLASISAGTKSGNSSLMMNGFRMLGSEPADGAVETARGLILLRMNKTTEAVSSFRRAVEEAPEDSTRRYNLAVALAAAGNRAEAMRNIEEAIRLEPLMEDAYALAAEIDPKRATEWKQRYLRLAPQRFVP